VTDEPTGAGSRINTINAALRLSNRAFNAFEDWWESRSARRDVGYVLIGGFLASLVLIELNRQGWLPPPLAGPLSTNHFVAIDVAFTLFLVVELIGLVVGLATSVAKTAGQQFEVFSLILIRRAFKELDQFQQEPLQWTFDVGRETVQLIVVDATAALLIFLTLGLFYTLQRHQPITQSEMEQKYFVAQKKLVANILLLILGGLGVYAAVGPFVTDDVLPFFDTFYTVLIFSDILVVLISLRYSATYHVVFRNSGYAVATVMIRLSLAGPHYLDAALGVGAALFNLGVAAAYNYVTPAMQDSYRRTLERKATQEIEEEGTRSAEQAGDPPPGEVKTS
jgi:hypothetical protein